MLLSIRQIVPRQDILNCHHKGGWLQQLASSYAAPIELRGLNLVLDQPSADAVFLPLFRQLLEGSGRSQHSPDKDG